MMICRALFPAGGRGARALNTLIMGPPGGGKGTLSKKIMAAHDVFHLSVGDVLRGHVAAGTALGAEAKGFMATGALVPDELIVKLAAEELRTHGSAHAHVLLDGFPRTVVQAEALAAHGTPVHLALDLAVPTEEIVARISSRWVHAPSGRVYAYDFNPPRVEGQDDETGEPLVQREDDTPEAVRARLLAYDEFTAPLTQHYSASANDTEYRSFDGASHPELVAADKRSHAIWSEMEGFLQERLG
jgi:adenylate kinase